MIPPRIELHFDTTRQTKNGDNHLIEGVLTCCNTHAFEVFVVGRIKYGMFSNMYLSPDDDKTILKVRCKKCGKVITVFDSRCDGNAHCEEGETLPAKDQSIECKRCRCDCFSISIKYEYPDSQELEGLEITEMSNAFTWIWTTLECSNCGRKHRNFVDYETT